MTPPADGAQAVQSVDAILANSAGSSVRAAERNKRYPSSLAQHRFWVLDRLDPGNPALNVAVRWRIEGDLPTVHIERAFELILARHELLRTSLIEVDGEPVQLVRPSMPLRVPSIDLSVLPETDAFAECDSIAKTEARAPFNLASAPLIRVTHIRVRPDVAILLVTTHHAVCDGWSIGLLASEFGKICQALQIGCPPDLPELPVTYGEFSEWQRAFIAGEGLVEEEAFWSRTLEGMEYFSLPSDFPHRGVQPSASAIHSVLLPRPLTDMLGGLARRHGCTLFMTAYAALLTMLHRYTGATDITIGTQVAGRVDVDVENLVGLFINTLVLRADLSGNPSFADLLGRARETVANALGHEDMPLEKIIETMKPRRYPGHNAVFSVNFIFQRAFVHNADHGAFRLIDIPSYSAGALYDLNFFMVERPEGWRASCEFNTGLYEQATIDQFLRHFVNILAAVCADASARIASVPMLAEAERQQLVTDRNATQTSYPRHLSLPQLIKHRAAQTPTETAVVDGYQRLTYREIDRASDVLAGELLRRGIGPGARVGVFVPRSAGLVLAPLAIMKSGNTYVPLDPQYPETRLQQIAKQARLSAIVAQPGPLPQALASLPVVVVERQIDVPGEIPDERLPAVHPESAAYVIFTSGSTGEPKGVQVPHRALTNFLWAMREKPGFTAQDTIVAITTLCFDIAVLELFLPLMVGGRVVVASEEETRDGRLLTALLRGSRATVLQATPTTWRLLLDAKWQGETGLKMLSGGEALPQELADRLLSCGAELWNMYGPTETTIWSSAKHITAEDKTVTLGTPIANTQFYVVDGQGELVPPGGIGELMIGGDGVALGYWDMPETTHERFVPDRFGGASGARLYRTGDAVRMTRSGELQFLGRTDHQVKIRGFRIELGEIEAVLLRHPKVRNAVAIAGEGPAGDEAVLAYAEIPNGAPALRDRVADELRTAMTQSLPGYMRPAAIICLETFAVLPNGKTDRKALPRTLRTAAVAGTEDVPPGDEIAQRLQTIWRSVLGVEKVDRTADFFDLGGHSLLAARLLARVETAFGRRISLSTLFDQPTFAGLVKLLQSEDHREFDFRQVVRLQPGSERCGIFAINNTGIYLTLSRRLGEDLPVTALQLFDPSFPSPSLPESIEEIAAQYVKLVLRLQPKGPYMFLGWCNGGVLAFEMARQLERAGHSVPHVMVVDTWLPGYSQKLGPLRARLANYSYRWKMVMADWAEVRVQQKNPLDFLWNRKTISRLLRRGRTQPLGLESRYVVAEQFDRWLVEYLDQKLQTYLPTPISGHLTVFRSSSEPAGRFLDPRLGWSGYAGRGVEVVVVPGNHFSIFKDPGVSVLAQHIETTIGPILEAAD